MTMPEANPEIAIRYDAITEGHWRPADNRIGHLHNVNIEPQLASWIRDIENRDDRRNPRPVVRLVIEVPVNTIEEAKRLAEADWSPAGPLPEPEPMVAFIPGRMRAEYVNGEITKVWFSPAAGDAGYQGSSFFVDQGECPDEEDDRPFWHAMEIYLALNDPGWEG